MNLKSIKYLSIFLLLVAFAFMDVRAEGGDKKDNTLRKITGSPVYKKFNINNISTFFKNDGESDINPTGNSGLEFPKGSGKAAIFQAGFLWGGVVEGQTRVGGSVYRQGTVPGKILNSGVPANQLIGEDPNLAHVRNYRVRPDIIPPDGPRPSEYIEGDVSSEVNDGEGSAEEIIEAYYRDWREWRGQDGAPYTDVNNNGVYDYTVDIPGVPGADQTIWFVCNDTNPNQSQFMYGSLPMGIEEQVTVWGYNRTGALGNMLFRKYKIINKSNTTFEDMYVSMWNDPDLGDASDDFVGCDTLLSLTYVYNANAQDNIYGRFPAAAGFDFFQGPIVPSPGDSAIFEGQWIQDFKNLPMTAHYFYINPDAIYRDPTQGQYTGTLEWYNFMQGRIGTTGDIFPDPTTGGTTVFALYGDPVARTGWNDGLQHPPGDRRAGMASGPFDMAPGDEQEIVVAEICAGSFDPVDRLSAISLLKFYDLAAQFAYDNFFVIPPPPQAPQVTAAPLDGEIVLHWGENVAVVNATENYNNAGFEFEGYNVYQLPDPSATKDQAKLLATFDIVNGVGKIFDLVFDVTSGTVSEKVVQFGNDNGIQRAFTIKTDAFSGGVPLNNGSRYYFAVTAYAYNDELPANNNLENTFIPLTIVPQTTDPGVRYPTSPGDTLAVTHIGPSDGAVIPIVIDPRLLDGNTYEVTFRVDEADEGETLWTLTNKTTGAVVLQDQSNQSGDGDYPFTFGTQVKVQGPPPGVKQEDVFSFPDNPELWGWEITKGTRRFTWASADGFEWEGFHGAIGYGSPYNVFGPGPEPIDAADLKKVLLILGSVPDGTIDYENPGIVLNPPSSDPNFSYAYRYGRAFASAPAKPEFAPYIINAVAGYSYQDFNKSVPLSAWDIEDPANPRRLVVGYLENNAANALLDGRYFPGDFNNYDNTAASGPREWLFIFDADYSETPNPDFQVEMTGNPLPIMYWCTFNRRGPAPFSPSASGDDEFAIYPNKINTPADVFSFVASAPTSSQSLAADDVQKINVFPNPYYGVNPQEINKYERFVTINHLPDVATIRIFNLAGQLVRTIEKTTPGQYQRWDLATDSGLPVASGLYIIYVDMPELGTTKVLKAAVIQEQQILDRF